MTKRFCDSCDTLLTPEDDKPFVRKSKTIAAQAHVMVVNENNHVLEDICNKCKLDIVNEGEPIDVATLQSPHPTSVARALLPLQPSIPKTPPLPTPISPEEPEASGK